MIGVIADSPKQPAVEEFFQLFKTPWEFFLPSHHYDLILIDAAKLPADLPPITPMVIYGSRRLAIDEQLGVTQFHGQKGATAQWKDIKLPIYEDATFFATPNRESNHNSASIVVKSVVTPRATRVGYSLMREVAFLLSEGQPTANAPIPALELHIQLLREIMIDLEVPFIEVPPRPCGFRFMVCLTHDVDFTGVREHRFDRTMWGFLGRATLGSLRQSMRGRLAWSKCAKNWKAAFLLPLVHLGLLEDFWIEFDRYRIADGGNSTYYFIPRKNYEGICESGRAPKPRAAKYSVRDWASHIRRLVEQGCEIGLHGIDAWHDPQNARNEAALISDVAGQHIGGVRSHWLYWRETTPDSLDEAGLSYDSTLGYNDAIGFWAGTTQAFRFLRTKHLLELPLNIQDTALFCPNRMGLSEQGAMKHCLDLIDVVDRFGGALIINWHTRSLSPERLWGEFYCSLLSEIRKKRVWFGTAAQVAQWFRQRRALDVTELSEPEDGASLRVVGPGSERLPSFTVRVHKPRLRTESTVGAPSADAIDAYAH